MTGKYGTFDMVIGVPNDYEDHRCQYAREYVAEVFGKEIVTAWTIQKTIPIEPTNADSDKEYYEFGGHLDVGKITNGGNDE